MPMMRKKCFKGIPNWTHILSRTFLINFCLYRVYKKKLNRFEIALNFAKQLLVSSF